MTGVELEEAFEAGREQQLVLLFGSKTQDFKLLGAARSFSDVCFVTSFFKGQ